MINHKIVVGSGPAGISVTKGLLERGCKVTLLDVGNTIETEKQLLLRAIQNNNSLMPTNLLRSFANGKNKLKLPYGSHFIYEGVKDQFFYEAENCYLQSSFAQGGLSNVWGGTMAEYSADELSEWPEECRNLSSYYSHIYTWLDTYITRNTSSVISQQAKYLKKTWAKNQLKLEKAGFLFHPVSLAVNFKSCKFCGACQYGCPFGLIYHTSIHLDELKKYPNFNYINQVVVINYSEHNNKVELIIRYKNEQREERIFSDRVFIACGASISTMLYLRALNKPGKELILKDSQHFILPCLIDKRFKNVMSESLYTLCQLMVSINHKNISCYPVYMQFYTYMDLYVGQIKDKFKWSYPIVSPFIKPWIERLIAIQGYLDSRESNHLVIQYQDFNYFHVKNDLRISAKPIINKVSTYLKKNHKDLAFKPLKFLLLQSLVGQSNHVNGSLPMSSSTKEDKTDIWGRPSLFERIHFVDGSVLPPMPAGPITATIMANAYRIGKECPL